MIESINVYTDGGSRGNPGQAAFGVYITNQDGNKIIGFGKRIGIATNNVAEYQAVLEALIWIKNNLENFKKISSVNFFMDSNLVCSQLKGLFKIKNENLRSLFFSIKEKEKELKTPVSYSHIPREKNKDADKFVNLALDNEI